MRRSCEEKGVRERFEENQSKGKEELMNQKDMSSEGQVGAKDIRVTLGEVVGEVAKLAKSSEDSYENHKLVGILRQINQAVENQQTIARHLKTLATSEEH